MDRRGAVLVSALFSFFVLLVPARDVTFIWDDWTLLARLHEPWPARWLAPINEHWKPFYVAFFELEHALFGPWHAGYLATTWLVHVLNAWLLGKVLLARTGDERAAAIGVLAFGCTTAYREALWWAELGGLGLCFSIACAGFLALERWLATGSRRDLGLAALATFTAPFAFGSGLALGPALALEAAVLAPRERKREGLVLVVTWLAHLAVYFLATRGHAAGSVDLSAGGLGRSVQLGLVAIGLGIVRRVLLLPVADEPGHALVLTAVYVAFVSTAATLSRRRERARLLLAQAWLVLLIAPIALTRTAMPPIAGAWSRYQYLPTIAWTTLVACSVRLLGKRWWIALPILVALGGAHARDASLDGRPFAPSERRKMEARLLLGLVAAVRSSEGPVYDAPLPITLAWPKTRASAAVRELAPELAPIWTSTQSDATTAPYRTHPLLTPLIVR